MKKSWCPQIGRSELSNELIDTNNIQIGIVMNTWRDYWSLRLMRSYWNNKEIVKVYETSDIS
jgi:hypothetical protein